MPAPMSRVGIPAHLAHLDDAELSARFAKEMGPHHMILLKAVGVALAGETRERETEIRALGEQVAELQRRLDNMGQADKWTPGSICRADARRTHYLGQLFRAKCDTIAEPGTDDSWERVGSGAGLRPRGGYRETEVYEDGDLVMRDYSTLLCLNGELHLLAARGAKGEQGLRGPVANVEIKRCHLNGPNLHLTVVDSRGEHDIVASLEPLVSALAGALKAAQYEARLVSRDARE
jgi:hypothetical protein